MWALVSIVVVITVILIAVFRIGSALPEGHCVELSRIMKADRDHIWQLISFPSQALSWRRNLKSVEEIGPDLIKETDRRGKSITFRTLESEAPKRLVREIADTDLPFGGTWTIQVEPAPEGSCVTIVERGFIKPPLFRFLAHFVFDQASTMKNFLDDLEAHLEK